MSCSQADYAASFDAEGGEAAGLVDRDMRIRWYNEGQARLVRKKASIFDLTWNAGDSITDSIPGFLQLDKGRFPPIWSPGENIEQDVRIHQRHGLFPASHCHDLVG